MTGSADSVCVLTGLLAAVAGVDVSELGEDELALLLSDVRVAQRSLDGLVMRIGVRCNHLAANGSAVPLEDFARGGGMIGSRQARREAARASAAEQVTGLGDAVSNGHTTGEHVDSIARHTAKLSEEQRAVFNFEDLVERAGALPVETFDRYLKRRIDSARGDHGLADTKAKRTASEFRHWYDQNTGMGHFTGTLDPERYEAVTGAVEHYMTAIATRSGEKVTKSPNLAAQALVDLVTTGKASDTRSRLPYITVVVDHDTIVHGAHDDSVRQTENGHDLPPETMARLCCDAVIRRVTLDHVGTPINVGRKHRTATDAQWAAIKTAHSECAWDGCAAPISWCQAHHIQEWENGGPTDLGNLVPLCSTHHHRVHEGRWKIKVLRDRSLKIYKPDGTHHTTTPTPQRC